MSILFKILRQSKGYTQVYLASALCISQAFLSQIERGERKPSGPIINRYSKIFNIPLVYFALLDSDNYYQYLKINQSYVIQDEKVNGLIAKIHKAIIKKCPMLKQTITHEPQN